MAEEVQETWFGITYDVWDGPNGPSLETLRNACIKYSDPHVYLPVFTKVGYLNELVRIIKRVKPRPEVQVLLKDLGLHGVRPSKQPPPAETGNPPTQPTAPAPGKTPVKPTGGAKGQPPVVPAAPTPGKAPKTPPTGTTGKTPTQGAVPTPGKTPVQQPPGTKGQPPSQPTAATPETIEDGPEEGSDPDIPTKQLDQPRRRIVSNPATVARTFRELISLLEQEQGNIPLGGDRGLSFDPDAIQSRWMVPDSGARTVKDARAVKSLLSQVDGIGYIHVVYDKITREVSIDREGDPHRYLGRGPVWEKNSCPVDVCIVAGWFLEAGSTVADRGSQDRETWLASLTSVQTAFLTVLRTDFNHLQPKASADARDAFLNAYLLSANRILGRDSPRSARPLRRGQFFSATNVWDLSTTNFHQFSFACRYRSTCQNCSRSTDGDNIAHSSVSIDLRPGEEEQDPPLDFRTLLGRYFQNSTGRPCRVCKSQTDRRRIITGDLPPRLVVQPHPNLRDMPGSTNDNVDVEYMGEDLQVHRAAYSWIGGIYLRNNHYVLFWRDGEPGDGSRTVRLYDGRNPDEEPGLIIGGIAPAHPQPGERIVPRIWERGAELLFYERVDNPIKDNLNALMRRALGLARTKGAKSGAGTKDDPMDVDKEEAGDGTTKKRKHDEGDEEEGEEGGGKKTKVDEGDNAKGGRPRKKKNKT